MSSIDLARGTGSKPFPLQLAQGVLQDLFVKELDAHRAPGDDGKKAAVVAAKEGLPRRMALLKAQIGLAGPSEVVAGFVSVIRGFWNSFNLPLVALSSGTTPSFFLSSSLWLETLTALFQDSCSAGATVKSQLTNGGRLVMAALAGIGNEDEPFSSLPAARVSALVALMQWWGAEVCSGRWRVRDAWGFCAVKGKREDPLSIIAEEGLAALVPLALDKGCPVNGSFAGKSLDSPAALALVAGDTDVVTTLMAHGLDLVRPYDGDGWPLVIALFVLGQGDAEFLTDLLRSQPDLVRASCSPTAKRALNVLGAALVSKDPAVVDLALSFGAPVEYGCRVRGGRFSVRPSLSVVLGTGIPATLKLVITKGKALEGWNDKYDEAALQCISESLASLAVNAYPLDTRYRGHPRYSETHTYNPRALEFLEMVFASGIVCPWGEKGLNSLLCSLYPFDSAIITLNCLLGEKHALAVLKRFHAAGFDVFHRLREHSTSEDPLDLSTLSHMAAMAGHPLVLDWSLTESGCTSLAHGKTNFLTAALQAKGIACARLLLDKYNAPASMPTEPLTAQPVLGLLMGLPNAGYTDAEAEAMLGALIERDPSLFAIECFSPEAVDRIERENPLQPKPWNPLLVIAMAGLPRTLECLLKKDLPGVAAMVNRPMLLPAGRLTAAQVAANNNQWECLGLLLRYTNARVTDSYGGHPTAFDVMERAVGSVNGPTRAFVAEVQARAKTELAEKAKASAASQAAGSATNAFEDPSVKPLTEQEEKRKAKKKAAKKKAKAKKKAAANAGAGGADPVDSSSDDDDGPHEDEPDDNLVDSRNAPSLDLMLEQMGLKEKK